MMMMRANSVAAHKTCLNRFKMRDQCAHVKIPVRLDVDSVNMLITSHRRDGILSNFDSVML